jgi:hypothetical protein
MTVVYGATLMTVLQLAFTYMPFFNSTVSDRPLGSILVGDDPGNERCYLCDRRHRKEREMEI